MTDSTTSPSGLSMAGWEHSFIDVDVIEAQWQKIPRSKSGPKVLGEHLWTTFGSKLRSIDCPSTCVYDHRNQMNESSHDGTPVPQIWITLTETDACLPQ